MKLSFEKKAFFAVSATLGAMAFAIFQVGKANLWFEPMNTYYTTVSDADGLFPGSVVTMSGLRIGEIQKLRVNDENLIEVMFQVQRSLAHKIRFDSVAQVNRSFVIGEKRMEITAGTPEVAQIANFGRIQGAETQGLSDLINSANINQFVQRIDGFLNRMEGILKAFSKVHPEDLEKAAQVLYPTLNNINRLTGSLRQDLVDTKVLQKSVKSFERIATPVASRQALIQSVLNNTERISGELESNKQFTLQINQALQELIITLKALQKTWMLSDYVDDVKKGGRPSSQSDDEDED